MKQRIMVKHIPQRTCVACRTVKSKRELARLVRMPGGDVEIDRSGKAPGRGAYLCRNLECWEAGLKGNRLSHTLRTTVSKDNLERLMEQGRNIWED
ncbi:MAG: YlxR family protein [Dehalococcoidales bacterium]